MELFMYNHRSIFLKSNRMGSVRKGKLKTGGEYIHQGIQIKR